MTPLLIGGIMLANLINQHALADAQAGNWDAVASALNALTHTVTVGRVGGKASLAALVANGIDPNAVIDAMRSVPMASELLNTLTASGVDWADDLTAFVMGGLVEAGKITQQTADVMRSLSVRLEPLVSTTADDCKRAWIIASCINPIMAAHAAAASKLNNAQASLGPEHTDGLTLEELQARCDAITTSEDGSV
jgi:hypothetical protein